MGYVAPAGFRLVYEGGHHDVYCNDRGVHIWTRGGGKTGISEARYDRTDVCDCDRYVKKVDLRPFGAMRRLLWGD